MNLERAAAIEQVHAATGIYTAAAVVADLMAELRWPQDGGRLCDPSCGDGSFLGAALQRLLVHQPHITEGDLIERIEGWEFHPQAASDCRERLTVMLVDHGWALEVAERAVAHMVICRDFLTEGPVERELYSAIVSNPPYLRMVKVPGVLQAEYREVVPEHVRSDLMYGFLARTAGLLTPDGEMVVVTADRWLFNCGAKELRQDLGGRLGIDMLKRLDASTSFYRPKKRSAGTAPRVHPVAVVLRRQPRSPVHVLDGSKIFPGSLAPAPAEGGRTLADVADVRLAPWLGTRGVFEVDPIIAASFPPEATVPAVETKDFIGGMPQIRRYALVTAPNVQPHPAVMRHLENELPRMCDRGRRQGCTWLPPEPWAAQFRLDRPCLLLARVARSLNPLRLQAGVLPTNHAVVIQPKAGHSIDFIESVLRSAAAQAWLHEVAPRLEDGFHQVSVPRIRQLPLDQLAAQMDESFESVNGRAA